MTNQQTMRCVFCQGTGNNPHFKGTCPACKGRGKNEVPGKYMPCSSCRGCGQKGGTTLTCYDCGGLGVVPDTRETFRKAREEIGEAQEEIARERAELTEKPMIKMTKKSKNEEENGGKIHFCQCCASEVDESIQIKVCHDCFGKMKEIA